MYVEQTPEVAKNWAVFGRKNLATIILPFITWKKSATPNPLPQGIKRKFHIKTTERGSGLIKVLHVWDKGQKQNSVAGT